MIKDTILVTSVMFGCFAMGYILSPKIDYCFYRQTYRPTPAGRDNAYRVNYRSYNERRERRYEDE